MHIYYYLNSASAYLHHNSVNRKCISTNRYAWIPHPLIDHSVNIIMKYKHLFRTTQLLINIFHVLLYFCMFSNSCQNYWRHRVNFMAFYVYLCTRRPDSITQCVMFIWVTRGSKFPCVLFVANHVCWKMFERYVYLHLILCSQNVVCESFEVFNWYALIICLWAAQY